jgi:hypothetical protein
MDGKRMEVQVRVRAHIDARTVRATVEELVSGQSLGGANRLEAMRVA